MSLMETPESTAERYPSRLRGYLLGSVEANWPRRRAGGNRSHAVTAGECALSRKTAGRCLGNGQNDDNAYWEDGRRMIGNNATVLPLRDYRAARRTLYFTRGELNQLLGLYSRNVARGVWRDYAFDHRDGQAQFAVFRHTHESAAYTIVKSIAPAAKDMPGHGSGEPQFVVMSGRQRLRAAKSLAEALDFFRAKLTVVPGARG
jgi:hypothetical protein